MQGLAAGMAHMHAKGIVDQDLHAGNVLLSPDGRHRVKTALGSPMYAELHGQPTMIPCCM